MNMSSLDYRDIRSKYKVKNAAGPGKGSLVLENEKSHANAENFYEQDIQNFQLEVKNLKKYKKEAHLKEIVTRPSFRNRRKVTDMASHSG